METRDGGRTRVGNTSERTPEQLKQGAELLAAAAEAQTAFWDALAQLEDCLDIELDSSAAGDLSGYDVESLIEFAEEN